MIQRLIAVMLIAGCAAGQGILPGLLAYKNANAWPTIQPDACVLAYDFRDGTAKDRSDAGNDGTILNAVPANGVMNFNGADAQIYTAASAISLQYAFTVSAWVKPAKIDIGNGNVIMAQYNTGSNNRSWDIYLLSSGGYKIRVNFGDPADGTTEGTITTGAILSTNTWQHVAVTYSSGTALIYLNGVVQSSSASSGSVPASLYLSAERVRLGAILIANSPTAFFNGLMDDALLHDVALTSNEVWQVSQEHPHP